MMFFSIEDMIFGMILGMIAGPLLMKLIKSLRQIHRVNKLLREAAANLQNDSIS